MKPKFIDHIVIIVKDVRATERFYTAFLGKPIQSDKEQVAYAIGHTKVFFGLPYGKYRHIDISKFRDKFGLNHLAFGARSLKELRNFERALRRAKIRNSGIQIDKYGGKEFIWFDDPSGNRIEFYLRKSS